jgi:hypothetical protein
VTQIISVITQEYSFLVSDRLLTYGEGPKIGEQFRDDECKLVSLCNKCGIGYSGLAQLGGIPTHEWIAYTLAAANCREAYQASQVLAQMAPGAIRNFSPALQRQIFLIVGWAQFDKPPGLRSHFCLVTNAIGQNGQLLAAPLQGFDCRVRSLKDEEQFLWYSIGEPVRKDRTQALESNLRRLVAGKIGPEEVLRLLVDEVLSTHGAVKTVGEKILGFCIPKKSVESQLKTGQAMMVAKLPDEYSTAFTYFAPEYNELRQYGPTYVCGEFAATEVQTENDPSRDFQSASLKILHLPKRDR